MPDTMKDLSIALVLCFRLGRTCSGYMVETLESDVGLEFFKTYSRQVADTLRACGMQDAAMHAMTAIGCALTDDPEGAESELAKVVAMIEAKIIAM
jgi:hypothetical protein